MAKIINSTYVTLDGVVEGPHLWPSLDRPGDEGGGQIQTDLLLSCDAVLIPSTSSPPRSPTLAGTTPG
jgi:hypothetical protein